MAGTAGGWAAASVAGLLTTPKSSAAQPGAKTVFELRPIGVVEIKNAENRLRIFEEFQEGLLGLKDWSHVLVFYWFDQNDTPEKRRILKVHPRGNKSNPPTGVFACRAPFRPNLIALSTCKIRSVDGGVVIVEAIDAFDGTPLLDLKPFTPQDAPAADTVRVPGWARGGP